MPRLGQEITNYLIASQYEQSWWMEFKFDPTDAPPLDVCRHCKEDYFPGKYTIDAPNYEDDCYSCAICARHLTEHDND